MHHRIETYLAGVDRCLRRMPEERRREEIAELAAHLDSSVAARMAGGVPEEDAVGEVLLQFGRPGVVGRGLVRAWLRGGVRSLVQSEAGAAVAYAVTVQLLGAAVLLSLGATDPGFLLGGGTSDEKATLAGASLAANLAAGAVAGAAAPRHARRGTRVANLLFLAWGLLLSATASTGGLGSVLQGIVLAAHQPWYNNPGLIYAAPFAVATVGVWLGRRLAHGGQPPAALAR